MRSEPFAFPWPGRIRTAHVALVLGPLFVAAVVRKYPGRLDRLSAGIVALGLLVWLAHRPVLAVQAIVVLMPFSLFWLGGIFALGVPATLVQSLGLWKELVVASLVIGAVVHQRGRSWHADRLDVAALGYIAAVVVYYLAPHVFAQAGTSVLSASVRNIALRTDVLFVLLFVAVKNSDIDPVALDRIAVTVLIVGTIVAAIGIFEFLFPSVWNSLAVDTFRTQVYQAVVLRSPVNLGDVRVHGQVGGRSIVRIGSTLLSPITLGPFLVLPFALGIERIARQRATSRIYLAVGVVTIALLLTQTRSAVIGALLICVLAIRPAPGQSTASRIRFGLLLAAAAVLAFPVVTSSGLSARTTTAIAGRESSAQDHLTSFRVGVETLAHHPLGQGLGTSPGVAQRFDLTGRVTSENYYLQVGDELGMHTMLAFVAVTVLLLRRLKQAAQHPAPPLDTASAVRAAAVALAIGAFLLHIWQDFSVALTFWAVAGVTLASSRPPRLTPRTASTAVAFHG